MINKKKSQPYLGKFRQGYVIKWGFWLVKFLDSVKIRKKKKKVESFFFFSKQILLDHGETNVTSFQICFFKIVWQDWSVLQW